MNSPSFSALLQRFFTDWLPGQLSASPYTVACYRDAFRLLLNFGQKRLKQAPSELRMEEIDASLVSKFLEHLELHRHNSIRTRNNRLFALHAFFRYVALSEPALALHCQRILAIPVKRYERAPVVFLTEDETAALVQAPDPTKWIGRRDRALLLVAVQTGMRNTELTSLRCQDVHFGTGAHIRCVGKGRKTRCTPLRTDVAAVLKQWIMERGGNSYEHVFPASHGTRLSADAFQRLVTKYSVIASRVCPSLISKKVTPHTLRHTSAMNLLRHGVDLSVIALWLGHESTESTQAYLHADMQLKEKALSHATSPCLKPARFRPSDPLLAFLDKL
jgi:site-specific recombinase XerD